MYIDGSVALGAQADRTYLPYMPPLRCNPIGTGAWEFAKALPAGTQIVRGFPNEPATMRTTTANYTTLSKQGDCDVVFGTYKCLPALETVIDESAAARRCVTCLRTIP